MPKRKLAVGEDTPGAVGEAAASTVNLARAAGSAAVEPVPTFTQTEAILAEILNKVLADIERVVGKLPEGMRPNTLQLNQIISVAVANYRNQIAGKVSADLFALVQAGKGPFDHDPAALA